MQRETKAPCLVCGKGYILGNMRLHVGRHILHDMYGQADPKSQEVRHVCIYTQLTLMPRQLGLGPCGFRGGEECTIKLDPSGHERFKIVSSCRYAYSSFNYECAKLPTKSSPCTNIPIICPFCDSPNATRSIWKYNTIAHIAVHHPDEPLPLEFLAQMHISLLETQLMKADLNAMKSYRKVPSLMNLDDFPEGMDPVTRDKHSRALSASSAGGSRKNARPE